MDQDAVELRHIEQPRQVAVAEFVLRPILILRGLDFQRDVVCPVGDSGCGIHFLFAIVEPPVFVQVSHGIFDGVADLLPVDVEPADGIGRLQCDAFQK